MVCVALAWDVCLHWRRLTPGRHLPHHGHACLPASSLARRAVTDYALDAYSVDMGTWYSEFSDLSSDANDPMPLSPLNADQSGGYVDESGTPLNVFRCDWGSNAGIRRLLDAIASNVSFTGFQ